jgi:transposase
MKVETEAVVRDIKRRTRRKFNAEEKIRIVLEGLRGESSIAELCRKEGIQQTQYYGWSKEFLEAGKKRLNGDTERQANSGEVKGLLKENESLKGLVADLALKVQVLKKSLKGLE